MVEIIEAKEEHIPALGKLITDFIKYTEDINPVFGAPENADKIIIEKDIRPAIKSKNSKILVALDDGQIIGHSYAFIIEPDPATAKRGKYGYIHDLFVIPEYRRRGIGKQLFDEILKWFHSLDIDRVELEVIVGNYLANSFWKKHGFSDHVHRLYKAM
ncbi:GNAT family N-acetyltransferase [Chloroflexota bacterium]